MGMCEPGSSTLIDIMPSTAPSTKNCALHPHPQSEQTAFLQLPQLKQPAPHSLPSGPPPPPPIILVSAAPITLVTFVVIPAATTTAVFPSQLSQMSQQLCHRHTTQSSHPPPLSLLSQLPLPC